MIYQKNRLVAIFNNTEPSKTDQSMATETDINVIVGRFLKTGMIPPRGRPPMYGDFSVIPSNLMDAIFMGRMMQAHREELPEQLRDMPLDDLFALTDQDLKRILAPPASAGKQSKEQPSETVRDKGQTAGTLQEPVPGGK